MNYKLIAERVVVTFFQAAIAYIIVLPNSTLSKTVIAGAIGAGLSAVYNVVRESTPTQGPNLITEPHITTQPSLSLSESNNVHATKGVPNVPIA